MAFWLLNPDVQTSKKQQVDIDFATIVGKYLGKNINSTNIVGSPVDLIAHDIRTCYELFLKLSEELNKYDLTQPFLQQESCLIPVIARMEMLGVGFDPSVLLMPKDNMEGRMKELELEANSMVNGGIKITSPQQLQDFFYNKLRYVSSSNHSRKKIRSVDEEALREFNHPLSHVVIEFRTLQKLVSGYVEPLVKKAVHMEDVICFFFFFALEFGTD